MILSKGCEYGIRAVISIAISSQSRENVSLKQVSLNIESPESFTSKILQKLVRSNLINSVKGAKGGFNIELQKMRKMMLWDVVEAIDGSTIIEKCILGMGKCSNDNPCPVHDKYSLIKENMISLLNNTSIKELSIKVTKGESVLKINKQK